MLGCGQRDGRVRLCSVDSAGRGDVPWRPRDEQGHVADVVPRQPRDLTLQHPRAREVCPQRLHATDVTVDRELKLELGRQAKGAAPSACVEVRRGWPERCQRRGPFRLLQDARAWKARTLQGNERVPAEAVSELERRIGRGQVGG